MSKGKVVIKNPKIVECHRYDANLQVKDVYGEAMKCTFIGISSDEMRYCFWDLKSRQKIQVVLVDIPKNRAWVEFRNHSKPRKESVQWKKDINEEMVSLEKNQTCSLVRLLVGKKASKRLWMFRVKKEQNGRKRLVMKEKLKLAQPQLASEITDNGG
nr:retrovirus-related Pol polyprotein from transposon TNT 1-94 [Tanacetum cinerariifolium]